VLVLENFYTKEISAHIKLNRRVNENQGSRQKMSSKKFKIMSRVSILIYFFSKFKKFKVQSPLDAC
jgi:hypothetical protein